MLKGNNHTFLASDHALGYLAIDRFFSLSHILLVRICKHLEHPAFCVCDLIDLIPPFTF